MPEEDEDVDEVDPFLPSDRDSSKDMVLKQLLHKEQKISNWDNQQSPPSIIVVIIGFQNLSFLMVPHLRYLGTDSTKYMDQA